MQKIANFRCGWFQKFMFGSVMLMPAILFAQSYPNKPIRIIVGSAPGGAPDVLARAIAPKLNAAFGQPIVIDNRAGASGAIGAGIVANATADGYTLFVSTTMGFAILPNVRKKLNYDSIKDFSSITQLAKASNVLVVNPAIPARTVSEMIKIEKSSPGTLSYGSAGNGSPAHLAGEMINMMAGIRMTHVPYKGAAPALVDVIAGQVKIIITSPISAGPHIATGRVRALATTGLQRNPALPDLPTVADTLPGYEISQWWGLSAPSRTPKLVIDKLHGQAAKAINMVDVREIIIRSGAESVGGSPTEYDALIAAERKRFGGLIRKAGIPSTD